MSSCGYGKAALVQSCDRAKNICDRVGSETSLLYDEIDFPRCVRRLSGEDRNVDFDGEVALGQEMNGMMEQTIRMVDDRTSPMMGGRACVEDYCSHDDGPDVVQNLNAIQGVWIDTAVAGIDKPIGQISRGQIEWNQRLFAGQNSSPLKLLANGKIGMQVGSEVFTSVFRFGPPAMLKWNDGATWIRDELQGLWVDATGIPVGHISKGKFTPCVDSIVGSGRLCSVSPIPLAPHCVVTLSCPGQSDLRAAYEPGQPAKLTWRNGTSWTRAALRT